jgi:hypothetical protein
MRNFKGNQGNFLFKEAATSVDFILFWLSVLGRQMNTFAWNGFT